MAKEKTLNARQWALYNFLKDNYQENYYIAKQTICTWLPDYYEIKEGETRVCRAIENDVRMINNCELIQKIIVSNKYGYKIGNEQECQNYINKRFERDLKSLKLNWKLAQKVGLDGQMRLTFGKGYERNFIETFME